MTHSLQDAQTPQTWGSYNTHQRPCRQEYEYVAPHTTSCVYTVHVYHQKASIYPLHYIRVQVSQGTSPRASASSTRPPVSPRPTLQLL